MHRRIIPEIKGYTKRQVVSFVQMKIKSSPEWAKRAAVVLLGEQTPLERKNHLSSGHNLCGFGRNDSPLLTHLACRVNQNRATKEDIEKLQRKLPRYARQLICLSFDKDDGKALRKHLDLYYKDSKAKMPY